MYSFFASCNINNIEAYLCLVGIINIIKEDKANEVFLLLAQKKEKIKLYSK